MTREEKYLEAGKIIIDFAKTHDVYLNFGNNYYIMLLRFGVYESTQYFIEVQIRPDTMNLSLFDCINNSSHFRFRDDILIEELYEKLGKNIQIYSKRVG